MTIVITRRESFHLPDGINIFIFTLAEELIRRGHRVVAVSTCQVLQERVQQTFRCSAYPELIGLTNAAALGYIETGLAWLRHGRRAVAKCRPDLVIINGALPVKLPGPSVAVSHDIEQRVPRYRTLRILYKSLCYRLADRIVATCTEVADALAKEIHVRRSSIQIIPTCMNVENYSPKPFGSRRPLIVHMGTVAYKNPLTTLKAFALLENHDAMLQVTGPLTSEVENFTSTLDRDVRHRIIIGRFLSAQELKELLETARIVSVPSDYSVPVASPTVLESFAAGTPVVCSRSISRDLVHNGEDAIIAETPEQVSKAFNDLLTEDKLWQRLSLRARNTLTKFSASAVAAQYEGLIQAPA